MFKDYKDKNCFVITGSGNSIGRGVGLGSWRGAKILVVDIHADDAEKQLPRLKKRRRGGSSAGRCQFERRGVRSL